MRHPGIGWEHPRSGLGSIRTACLGIAVVVIAAACSSGGGSSPSPSSSGTLKASQPKAGGSITVLESRGYSGDWPFGLDPATNTDAAPNQDFMEAIYDQAAEYIARNYYGPFYFSLNPTNVSAKGIGGPGLTSPLPAVAVAPTIPWEDVWYNTSAS